MPGVKTFEELLAWQKTRDLVRLVYIRTQSGAFAKDYGLRDQLQRATVSVMSNIAEGFGRGSNREFARFLDIARASMAEVQSLLYVALDVKYLEQDEYLKLKSQAAESASLIAGLSGYLKQKETSSK
jgi:four helix bundle protein